MNVKEIVRKYLKDNGYDGLGYEGEEGCCSCSIANLLLCGHGSKDCVAVYLGCEIDEESSGVDKHEREVR